VATISSILGLQISTIIWMEWPRGDSRFVGEWTMSAGERPPSSKLILRRNGTGLFYENSDSDDYEYFVWRVEGEWLVYGHPANRLTRSINGFWRWLVPGSLPLLPYDNPYPILDAKQDEIRLRNTWNIVTLRRVRSPDP
jgi:hypothetical protein